MSIDLAKTLALREQAGAYKLRAGLVLGIVTDSDDDDWTVTVTLGNGPIIVPRLRHVVDLQADDVVLLGRSGSAIYCLGALNLTPVTLPVDPNPQPPPPPPATITQTFRAETTGFFTPGAPARMSTPASIDGWTWEQSDPPPDPSWVEWDAALNMLRIVSLSIPYGVALVPIPTPGVDTRVTVRLRVRADAPITGPSVEWWTAASNTFPTMPFSRGSVIPASAIPAGVTELTGTGVVTGSEPWFTAVLGGGGYWVESIEVYFDNARQPEWSAPGANVPQGDIGSTILAMLGDFETSDFDGWSLSTTSWNYLVGPLEDWYLPPLTGSGYMVASARADGTGPVLIGSTTHQSVNDPVSVAVRVNASTGSRVRMVVIPDTGPTLTLDRTITWGRWTPMILDVANHGGGYTVELYSLDPWVGQAVHVDAVAEVERQAGAVYYGEGPSTLAGNAVSGSLRIRRLAGGIPVPWQPMLRLLPERTRLDTGPGSPIGTPLTGPLLAVGETTDLALPLAWVAALLDGTAGGIAPDPSGDPMWLAGRDTYTAAFDLTLTRNGGS